MKTCANCSLTFEPTQEDQHFYQKMGVPEPTHCPSCRLQRRLAHRNETHLYYRNCDLCHKATFSFYDADAEFPVYCIDCFWSDRWDPAAYGRDFDFSRPFFEQFAELIKVVPQSATLQLNNENSAFNSLIAYSKNAYMCAGSHVMEDSYYCRKSQYSTDCMHSQFLDHCELVAYSMNCKSCYKSHHLLNCRNCSESAYLANCSNCKNCFMCSDLRGKEYYFKNQPLSKESYEEILEVYSKKDPQLVMQEFLEFKKSIPKANVNLSNCENSTGDYLSNASNAQDCFDCFDVQDSKYLTECESVKDSMDLTCHDKNIQLCYELITGGESNYNAMFSVCNVAGPNNAYCVNTFYLSDSFGCSGFHSRKQYHILNKAYSQEEYTALKHRIIEHMKQTGEWGEFLPISLSNFPYNESIAQVYFPLTKETALAKGYRWKDQNQNTAPAPDAQTCSTCHKAFKVIPQEQTLSKKIEAPAPQKCASCMSQSILGTKNPRYLWQRNCQGCRASMQSSYSPERHEQVYCQSCYLEVVY